MAQPAEDFKATCALACAFILAAITQDLAWPGIVALAIIVGNVLELRSHHAFARLVRTVGGGIGTLPTRVSLGLVCAIAVIPAGIIARFKSKAQRDYFFAPARSIFSIADVPHVPASFERPW